MKITFQHNMLDVRSPASVNPSSVDPDNLTKGFHALLAVIHPILHMFVCFCAQTRILC